MKRNNFFILTSIIFILISPIVLAHPGSLDSNGGHYNRKTGEYHYHDGTHTEGSSSKSTYDTFDHDYFKKNNTTSSSKQKEIEKTERSFLSNIDLDIEEWLIIILIICLLVGGIIVDPQNTLLMICSIPFIIISFGVELLWEVLKGFFNFFKILIKKIFK